MRILKNLSSSLLLSLIESSSSSVTRAYYVWDGHAGHEEGNIKGYLKLHKPTPHGFITVAYRPSSGRLEVEQVKRPGDESFFVGPNTSAGRPRFCSTAVPGAVRDFVEKIGSPDVKELYFDVESEEGLAACKCYASALQELGYGKISVGSTILATPSECGTLRGVKGGEFRMIGHIPEGGQPRLALGYADSAEIEMLSAADFFVGE